MASKGPIPKPRWQRIMSYFTPTGSDCWIWIGKPSSTYGQFPEKVGVNKPYRTAQAHRVVYEAFFASIPKGMQLDHLCKNKRCVNPLHMEVVTPRENLVRAKNIFVVNAAKTQCKWGHEFTPGNTYYRKDRPGRRECRTCRNIKSGLFYRKERVAISLL